jgi:hypothetical protein
MQDVEVQFDPDDVPMFLGVELLELVERGHAA